MSRVLLCIGRYADRPYRFERLDRAVWSVEELCYLLVQSAWLMEDDFPDEGLLSWLTEQCGLTELSRSLAGLIRRGGTSADAVREILEYVRYNTREEIEHTVEILRESAGRGLCEKRILRAEHFLKEGRLLQALAEYEEVEQALSETAGDRLLGQVLHNKGVICARLFLFTQAQEFFYAAYERTGSELSLEGYLAARRLSGTEEEYVSFIAGEPEAVRTSLRLEERIDAVSDLYDAGQDNLRLRALQVLSDEGRQEEFESRLDTELTRLRQAYRSETYGS